MKKFGLVNVLLQFKRVVYRCYIDDVFLLFKSNKHLKLFLNYMNLKHKNIKFTFETEDLNNFSVLDVKVLLKKKEKEEET